MSSFCLILSVHLTLLSKVNALFCYMFLSNLSFNSVLNVTDFSIAIKVTRPDHVISEGQLIIYHDTGFLVILVFLQQNKIIK